MREEEMEINRSNKERNMKQNLLTYLPSEIIIEILSRLPAQSILSCKCVCKWRHDLVETHEFAKLHVSRSVPELALTITPAVMDKTIQLINALDFHFDAITKLNFTHWAFISGSADGFLLLSIFKSSTEVDLRLCNPITREYIDLHHSQSHRFDPPKLGVVIYGFGVSKISGQYKAVAIFHDQTKEMIMRLPEPECKVYTIGTGFWRSIAPDVSVRYRSSHKGAFVDGNLHWLALDLNDILWISCFDLETEVFTTFPPPLVTIYSPFPPPYETKIFGASLFAVEGRLCVVDYTDNGVINIWMMKEYGVDKSWTKEFVIDNTPDLRSLSFDPITVSEDGLILMALDSDSIVCYSSNSKTTNRICKSEEGCDYVSLHSYTPSFISLKCFEMENSISF